MTKTDMKALTVPCPQRENRHGWRCGAKALEHCRPLNKNPHDFHPLAKPNINQVHRGRMELWKSTLGNNCDGCRAGAPIVKGLHRMSGRLWSFNDMACTAERYRT